MEFAAGWRLKARLQSWFLDRNRRL